MSVGRLWEVVAALRDPETGCPWDMEQTLESIAPYLIEEAYEVAEAVETGDRAGVREELGDALFGVVFLAQLASATLDEVAAGIAEKMERRHPHVFAGAAYDPAVWQADKVATRAAKGEADASALAGISVALPALTRAATLQRRAAKVGFDWPDVAPVYGKVREELDEVREAETDAERAAEVGDLLFACVNLARHLGVEPEQALRDAGRRFERRFRRVEALTEAPLAGQDIAALDALWERAKAEERSGPEPGEVGGVEGGHQGLGEDEESAEG